MASTQPTTQKTIFEICAKNSTKSAVKHFIEKHILLSFVNLSTIFCTKLRF